MGGATQQIDRRPDVISRLATIPYPERTTAAVFRVMDEVGVQNRGAMYDYVVKSGLIPKESELYKDAKGSAKQLPLTPDLYQLVQEQLPKVAATYQTRPAEPLGRVQIGAAQAPLTPDLLQTLVPALRAAPMPGQPPREVTALPPEALFGAEAAPALAALPQVPVPGQTVPSAIVTEAARAATTTAKSPSVGTDREAVALAEFGLPFAQLTPDQRKQVNFLVDTELTGRLERQGTARPIPPAEQTNIVDRRTLRPPTTRPTTYQEFYADPNLVAVNPEQREAYNTASDLVVVIETLDRLSQDLATATTGAEAVAQALKLEAGARTQTNPKAVAYRDFLESRLPDIAKKLSTQPGVLTERDIDRARATAWKFFDTKPVRDFKAALLRELFELQRQAAKDTALGALTDPLSARQNVERILSHLEELDERSRLEYLREKAQQGR
ncbi:MAG TPA: hypothetical protein VNN55_03080 [bacterium]|nr:hypothetical protein [bacterium]